MFQENNDNTSTEEEVIEIDIGADDDPKDCSKTPVEDDNTGDISECISRTAGERNFAELSEREQFKKMKEAIRKKDFKAAAMVRS